MQKSPEHRQAVFAVILLNDVGEAEQRHFLPAAPHTGAMDQGILGKRRQEEFRVPEHELHDWIGRDSRVSSDDCIHFLQLFIQVL